MPPDNGNPNGKVCPDCLKVNSLEECISDQTLVCKHEEDKCYTYVGIVRVPDGGEIPYSEKGCLSPSLCEFGFDLMVGFQDVSNSGIHCT
ncbi:hypothetical protein FKM82_013011 [Ascaphus truei]